MRRVPRVSPLPNRALIYADYASSASAQLVQRRLGDFEAHAEALQSRREDPAQVMRPQPETPDALSSADFAFGQPLMDVACSPGKTSASFARWCAPWRGGIRFLVRVAGIVQVA